MAYFRYVYNIILISYYYHERKGGPTHIGLQDASRLIDCFFRQYPGRRSYSHSSFRLGTFSLCTDTGIFLREPQ